MRRSLVVLVGTCRRRRSDHEDEDRARERPALGALGAALAQSTGSGSGSTSSRVRWPSERGESGLPTTPTGSWQRSIPARAPVWARSMSVAARSHSVDMARRGYFDHGAFVQRLRHFGVRAPYIGENLAEGTGGLGAVEVVQMWLASPPHRQRVARPVGRVAQPSVRISGRDATLPATTAHPAPRRTSHSDRTGAGSRLAPDSSVL